MFFAEFLELNFLLSELPSDARSYLAGRLLIDDDRLVVICDSAGHALWVAMRWRSALTEVSKQIHAPWKIIDFRYIGGNLGLSLTFPDKF